MSAPVRPVRQAPPGHRPDGASLTTICSRNKGRRRASRGTGDPRNPAQPADTAIRPATVVHRRGGRDEGQGTILVIAIVATAFVLLAFFVDVGRSLNAHGASLEVAAQAARVATDQVTQESLRTGEPTALRIDPAAAQHAGQAWLADAGATGTVSVTDGGTSVTVTARVPCKATLLAALGYRDLSKSATASATLLTGTPGSPGQPITDLNTPPEPGLSGGPPSGSTGASTRALTQDAAHRSETLSSEPSIPAGRPAGVEPR